MPTPVSALIHAATMVTAGVYLLIRSSPLIEYSNTVLLLILWIGAITTVFSSLIGLFQQDIKKVIAYSTMSQLALEYIIFIHQTICVEVLKVTNSQITKARKYIEQLFFIYFNISFFNSFSWGFAQVPVVLHDVWDFIGQIHSEKWKIYIKSKLVGISEAIRLILIIICIKIYLYKSIILFKQYNYKGYSIVANTNNIINKDNKEPISLVKFNEWLAGLIDGDGFFRLSKRGSARLLITLDIRDINALKVIKSKYGGTIRNIAGAKAVRYDLSNRKGLISLINAINGNIRNPARLLQMNKLCVKYDIPLIYPKPLSFNNGWLSGFIDSDGSIYFNEQSGQVFISISQRNMYLLEPLISIYGGRVEPMGIKIEAFKYVIYRKNELFNLIDNYFSVYPLKTCKSNRLQLIKEFYLLRPYTTTNNNNNLLKLKQWVDFKDKWDKYKC